MSRGGLSVPGAAVMRTDWRVEGGGEDIIRETRAEATEM